MSDRALAVIDGAQVVETEQPLRLTRERIDLLKRTVARDLETDDEFWMFMAFCQSMGLDPFSHEVFVIKRFDSRLGKEVVTYGIGIDGLRRRAERTGDYMGQVGPFWCGPDGQWRDVWLDDAPPAAAKVGVLRRGWPEPLWAVATWRSYAQYKRGTNQLMPNWASMPDLMLAKCAEALALRKAFPRQTGGLYIPEEIGVTFNELGSGESERREESRRITVRSSASASLAEPVDEDWIAAIEGAFDVPTLAKIGNSLVKIYRDRNHPVRQAFDRRMHELQSSGERKARRESATTEMSDEARRRQKEAMSLVEPYGWDLDDLQRWMRERGIHRWSDFTDEHLSALLDQFEEAELVEPEETEE